MAAAFITQYLLDTNILVHLIRRNLLGQWIEAAYSLTNTQAIPFISEVTEGEIRSLALQFGWTTGKLSSLQRLVRYFIPIPISDPGIFDAYATIDDYCRRSGITMGKDDVWIAATASITRARLLTTDRDFDHLDPVFLRCDYIDPHAHP